jgi:hypothetical protein
MNLVSLPHFNRRALLFTLAALPTPAWLGTTSALAQDTANQLPSWNDGPAMRSIIDFVRATTDQASPKFVPPEERIATFDQDGTLWVGCHTRDVRTSLRRRSRPRTGLQTCANNVASARLQLDRGLRWFERRRRMG